MELKRVVVTGLGAITPLGNTVVEYWSGLKKGLNGAAEITHFDATNFKTKFACEVKNFDPLNFMERKESRKMDLFSQYAVASAIEAVEDAGFNDNNINKQRVGVIWASGVGGLKSLQDEIIIFGRGNGTPRYSPFFVPKMIVDIASGHISMRFGFQGLNFATISACASGTNAIIDAFNYIRLGRATAIVAGGSEAAINESGIGGFNALRALSTRNDDAKTASRPFDKDRDGFVMGEGSGCLILEEYEHAKNRGAKIYAELVGGGMSADAHHLTAPHPEGEGARLVMEDVLDDAKLKPEDIDYINVHGTSTPLGDVAEVKAILKVFGESAYKLNISSTKSMTGHLLGGAGAIESLAAILAVKENVIPPTINNFNLDEQLDAKLNYTFNKAQEKEVNYALSNTFGFGGHNASLIFKKYIE